jgi:hypothetical protein
MRTIEIVPSASALVHSLRGVGYSPETAVADLLDNSIAAGATSIDIEFIWNDGDPKVAVGDNGSGMNEAALIGAMRFGGVGSDVMRSEHDLGRFGLGLKTASLSQCRHMTVISRRDGHTSALSWDIDEVDRVKSWEALIPEPLPDLTAVKRLLDQPHGTLVLWEHMDPMAGLSGLDRETFFRRIHDVRLYLGMIFHRFLGGDAQHIAVTVNGRVVKPWDPFQRNNPATITMQTEPIRYAGQIVRVTPYVLPHRDRFANEAAYEEAGGIGGWGERQGFYVYRRKRLLVAGGWLGLGGARAWTREEASRLARLAIDIPADLDGDWRIDVRKSQARPPGPMRVRLTAIAALCRERAREVFAWRGHRARRQAIRHVEDEIWVGRAAGLTTRYQINRKHPSIAAALVRAGSDAPLMEALLVFLERTVPVERIWLDVSEAEGASVPELQTEEIRAVASQLAALARWLPADMSASARANLLIRQLPGENTALRSTLVQILESIP